MSNSQDTLSRVRQIVGVIKKTNLDDYPEAEPLNLDSIERITLLVELENSFHAEFDASTIMPEAFESLATLVQLVTEQCSEA